MRFTQEETLENSETVVTRIVNEPFHEVKLGNST